MKGVRWLGPNDVRVEEVEKPRIEQRDDAVLRVTSAAVCGSDLRMHSRETLKPLLKP